MRFKTIRAFAVVTMLAVALLSAVRLPAQSGTILKPADTQKLLPATVYYKGQSAPVQIRNSSGVKFADGYYVLATMVDTSGYSSDLATKYQAYFIAEVPLKISSQPLPAGIYGLGFVGGGKVVITDVGGHDVLTVDSANDEAMKRPMPLQIVATPSGNYRLYAGRKYIDFAR